MKHRNLILLVVLLLLLAAFFLLRNRQPNEKEYRVFEADSTRIGSFEVLTAADTVMVSKVGNSWMLTYPVKWAVDQQRLKYFFDKVIPATYSGMPMSEGKNAVAIYDLTPEKALQIRVRSTDGKMLSHCYFGNTGNPFDYFRYDGEDKVYQVKQQIVGRLQPEISNWRSPDVLAISPERLEKISIKHSRNSYELSRALNAWYYKDKANEFKIPDYNAAMGKILNALASFQSYTMVSGSPDQVAGYEKACEVDITLTDGSKRRIDFLKDGEMIYVMLDNDPASLFVVVMDMLHRFTRHAAVFNIQLYP